MIRDKICCCGHERRVHMCTFRATTCFFCRCSQFEEKDKASRDDVDFDTDNDMYRETFVESRRCTACDEDRPIEKFNDESLTPTVCFRCKTRSVAVGGHLEGGREFFHNTTVKEGQRRTIAEAKANGIDAVPVKQSNYYGF